MGDFSSVTVSKAFSLPSECGHDARDFQTKDLPKDPKRVACIDGVIEANGMFVRNDYGIRYWNPELTGWAYFTCVGVKADFVARFENGRIVEVMEGDPVLDMDIGYSLQSAASSPNNWILINDEKVMSENLVEKNHFFVQIDGGTTHTIEVATGVYQLAAIAALAIIGCETKNVMNVVKIWTKNSSSQGEPYFFTWSSGEIGQLTGTDPRKW